MDGTTRAGCPAAGRALSIRPSTPFFESDECAGGLRSIQRTGDAAGPCTPFTRRQAAGQAGNVRAWWQSRLAAGCDRIHQGRSGRAGRIARCAGRVASVGAGRRVHAGKGIRPGQTLGCTASRQRLFDFQPAKSLRVVASGTANPADRPCSGCASGSEYRHHLASAGKYHQQPEWAN